MAKVRKILIFSLFFIFFLCTGKVFAAVWYVDSSVKQSGDGRSWNSAFKTIQEAIDAADDFDHILVKKGLYQLEKPIKIENKSLYLAGGFNGTETSTASWVGGSTNWRKNQTIIDGTYLVELDEKNFQLTHYGCIVINAHFANISGFYIRNGKATNVGGAIAVGWHTHFLTIENCIFHDNTAGDGGAISIQPLGAQDTFHIKNCTFYGNTAHDSGGAIYIRSSWAGAKSDKTISVENCTFFDNYAGIAGGAIDCYDKLEVSDCTFYENSEGREGAVAWGGGAIRTYGHRLFVKRSVFHHNSGDVGGAIFTEGNDVYILSSIFYANESRYGGGALHLRPYSCSDGPNIGPKITNCTFFDNSTDKLGGAIYVRGDVSTQKTRVFVTNTILWDNFAAEAEEDSMLNEIAYYDCEEDAECETYECDGQNCYYTDCHYGDKCYNPEIVFSHCIIENYDETRKQLLQRILNSTMRLSTTCTYKRTLLV